LLSFDGLGKLLEQGTLARREPELLVGDVFGEGLKAEREVIEIGSSQLTLPRHRARCRERDEQRFGAIESHTRRVRRIEIA